VRRKKDAGLTAGATPARELVRFAAAPIAGGWSDPFWQRLWGRNVPTNNFLITEGCADAPAGMCGFGIRPKKSTASLSSEWGEMSDMKPPNPILDPHRHRNL
jgi:hypothetical protein